jgi:hypothetical protein
VILEILCNQNGYVEAISGNIPLVTMINLLAKVSMVTNGNRNILRNIDQFDNEDIHKCNSLRKSLLFLPDSNKK